MNAAAVVMTQKFVNFCLDAEFKATSGVWLEQFAAQRGGTWEHGRLARSEHRRARARRPCYEAAATSPSSSPGTVEGFVAPRRRGAEKKQGRPDIDPGLRSTSDAGLGAIHPLILRSAMVKTLQRAEALRLQYAIRFTPGHAAPTSASTADRSVAGNELAAGACGVGVIRRRRISQHSHAPASSTPATTNCPALNTCDRKQPAQQRAQRCGPGCPGRGTDRRLSPAATRSLILLSSDEIGGWCMLRPIALQAPAVSNSQSIGWAPTATYKDHRAGRPKFRR